MGNDNITLVVFTMEVNDKVYEYGLPISQVHEITRPGETIKLPGMPDFVDGIMNLRGSIIPIIDCKKRFGLGTTVPQDTTRNIVVSIGKLKYGFVVDDVLEIVLIPGADIEEPPSIAGGVNSDFIIGIGKIDNRLIIALDAGKILTESEENELKSVS